MTASMPREEKISRLISINDDMARSRLCVYAGNEHDRNGYTDKFAASKYRYAKAIYLCEKALSQKDSNEETIAEIAEIVSSRT